MKKSEKKLLINRLLETRAFTRKAIEGADPDFCIYPDADWRIRDIIGHIATWDRQVVNSLKAFMIGNEYCIPDLDEDSFNQQQVAESREMTAHQVFQEGQQARKDFIQAIEEISQDRFHGDLLYPWGDERGNIVKLVEYMIEHEIEHREEIVKAIEGSNED
jgi:uncharacterized damage-inducible protein DinB